MKKEVHSDQELARAILAGDKASLRKFYRKFYSRLLAYVGKRVQTSEDAEEIVQDAFLGMMDSLPLYSARSSLWTFLVSVARHEIADYFRKKYAKKAIRYVPFVDQVYDKPMLSAEEVVKVFDRTLARLKKQEQKLLLWKYEEKLSVKEIAGRLGVGEKAAESQLYRARQAFMAAYVLIESGGMG